MPLMKRHCNVWLTNHKSDTLKCFFHVVCSKNTQKTVLYLGKNDFSHNTTKVSGQPNAVEWIYKVSWSITGGPIWLQWSLSTWFVTKVFIWWTNQFHLDEKEWAKFDETDRAVYLEIYLFCCNHTKINCCPDSTWSWSALIISAPSMYVMVLTLAVIMASCFIQLCQFRYCERK